MARPKSERVLAVQEELVQRIKHGFYRPGDRFFSARAIASRFEVSYQTAHNLLSALVEEGLLVRRAASGTYLPGASRLPVRVGLVFPERANRPGSFGNRLLTQLRRALDEASIPYSGADHVLPADDAFPIVWDCPEAILSLQKQRRYGLLLNERPPAGIASTFIDSVGCDDYSGGVAAGELVAGAFAGEHSGQTCIFSGPQNDVRSSERERGFRTLFPTAKTISAESWYHEEAVARAIEVTEEDATAVFCCNDGLAAAVLDAYNTCGKTAPPLVGFDDAPIAQTRGISTIAIPVGDLVSVAVDIARSRIAGDGRAAYARVFSLRPAVRRTCVPI